MQNVYIEILRDRCERSDALLHAIASNANRKIFNFLFSLRIQIVFTFASGELGIQARLCLLAQVFHHTCQNNNDPISCISSFIADGCIVSCFARLNIPQYKSAALEGLAAFRIAKQIDDFVGNFVQSSSYTRVPMLDFFEVLFIAIPEEEI